MIILSLHIRSIYTCTFARALSLQQQINFEVNSIHAIVHVHACGNHSNAVLILGMTEQGRRNRGVNPPTLSEKIKTK